MDSQHKEKDSQKLNWSVCNYVAPFKDEKPSRSGNTPNSGSIEELSILKYRHNLILLFHFIALPRY